MGWWQRLRAWLGLSEPGNRKEQFEDWLETNQPVFAALHAEQAANRSPRGGFRQIRRQERHLASMPPWADMEINVREEPVSRTPRTTRFGYSFTYTVTEADRSEWTMTVDPAVEASLEWREVKNVDLR